MAGIKHTYTLSVKNDAGRSVVASTTEYTAAAEENFDSTAEADSTLEIDMIVDVSQIVSFYIYSDQDVTLHTNATPTGTQNIDIDAKKPLWWNTDANGTNPLTADITKLYFVNSSTVVDAKIRGGFLLDLEA